MSQDEKSAPLGSPAPSTPAQPASTPPNPFQAEVAPVSDDAISPMVSTHSGVHELVNPSSGNSQVLPIPSHSTLLSVTAAAQGDSIGLTHHTQRESRVSKENPFEFPQHHRNQSPMAPQQSQDEQVIESLRNAIEQLTTRVSTRREQFSAYRRSQTQQTTSSTEISGKTALGFLLRKDRLDIEPSYANRLVEVYNLTTHEDLVEILHDYSVKESLSFLDRHFSLNEFNRMKTSMFNLVVFGRYLANKYKIESVPPLHELRWRTVHRSMEMIASSTMQDLVYQYDWLIRQPSAWLRENSYSMALPSSPEHPSHTFAVRQQQQQQQQQSTTTERNVPSVMNSLYGSLATEGARRDVNAIAQQVEGQRHNLTSELFRTNNNDLYSTRHSPPSLLQMPIRTQSVMQSNSTNQMQCATPASANEVPSSIHKQMPNVIPSGPSLIQRHFHTPGAQQHSNSEDRHNNATKSKVIKRTGFDATKIKWDGKIDSFPPVEAALRSYCMISQMGYLVRPHFLREYGLGMVGGVSIQDFHTVLWTLKTTP